MLSQSNMSPSRLSPVLSTTWLLAKLKVLLSPVRQRALWALVKLSAPVSSNKVQRLVLEAAAAPRIVVPLML